MFEMFTVMYTTLQLLSEERKGAALLALSASWQVIGSLATS